MGIFMSTILTIFGLSLSAIGTRIKNEPEESNSDPSKPEERTYPFSAFPSPSDIFDRIRNEYLPSVLQATRSVQALVVPKSSPPDFWDMAQKYENMLRDYIPRLLQDTAAYFKSTRFTDIASAMHQIVVATATFRNRIQGALDAHHITLDALTEELERIFMPIVHKLEKIPSPDKPPGHAERAEMVDKVLDDATLALINLAHRYGIGEEVVTTYVAVLRPQVRTLVIAVGDIHERHPKLFPTLAFCIAILLIPESWLLRPFLSLFGFGPSGPVRGSAAPRLQRRFWGGAVEAGGWLSLLQAAKTGKIMSDLRESFPNPASIFDSIQYTFLPSVLRAKSAIQALVVPQPDFWDMAKRYEYILQDYVPRLLKNAAAYFKSTKFADIISAMHQIVSATTIFRNRIQVNLNARDITLDTLTEELERIFMGILHDIKNIPSPDRAPGHAEREQMVDQVLDRVTVALIDLASRYGIDEEVVATYLDALKPQVRALTVAVGDINEQHPKLFSTLAFSIATLLIPESWILRPFLSLFGFGPSGPVKGSAAAWMQRYFWGGAVASGSWFAMLQAAGMGVLPVWAGFATKSLLATLFSCFGRRRG